MQPLAVDNALVSCQQPHSGPPQMASINEKAAMTGLAVQPAVRSSEHGLPRRAGQAHHTCSGCGAVKTDFRARWLESCRLAVAPLIGLHGSCCAARAPFPCGQVHSEVFCTTSQQKYTLFGPMSEIADFRCSCA